MNILFLTQILPYPPDAGPRVKTYNVLRYLLAGGHRVILASFVRPEERQHLPALQQMGIEVHAAPLLRSRLADIGYFLRTGLTGRPFLVERDDLPGMRALVRRLLETEPVDLIHADQLSMAQYALPYGGQSKNGGPRLVFDAHNAVWTIIERMRETARPLMKLPLAWEARLVKRYEASLLGRFDHILAVTEPDRQALLAALAEWGSGGQPDIHVVPIAVDTGELQPTDRATGSLNIVTLGTLHYPPNADGIRWFLNEVFPQVQAAVPGASLTIIGKNPPADFLQAAQANPQAVRVTGYVPDLTPYMEQAALMVVPVRAGGGMRVRILEAFARAMPVVTTTVGLEGIDARPEEEVLVADTPANFARRVIELVQDPAQQERLAQNGRRLAERCYDWQVILKKMDQIFQV